MRSSTISNVHCEYKIFSILKMWFRNSPTPPPSCASAAYYLVNFNFVDSLPKPVFLINRFRYVFWVLVRTRLWYGGHRGHSNSPTSMSINLLIIQEALKQIIIRVGFFCYYYFFIIRGHVALENYYSGKSINNLSELFAMTTAHCRTKTYRLMLTFF